MNVRSGRCFAALVALSVVAASSVRAHAERGGEGEPAAPLAPEPENWLPPDAQRENEAREQHLVRQFLLAHPEVACEQLGMHALPSHVFVACGSRGILVLDRIPAGLAFREQRSMPGDVFGFFEHDGKLWVRIVEERGLVIGHLAGEGASPPASAAPRPAVDTPPRTATPARSEEPESPAPPARPTRAPTTPSRVAPERVFGLYELRGMLRPMLNLGRLGGGVLAELDAGYRTRHFHLGASLHPLGIAGSQSDEVTSLLGGSVYGAYDGWLFSAGIGVGAQRVNNPDATAERGSGLSLVQLLRLGAVDGLHLSSRVRAVVFRSVTDFGGMDAQGQIPAGRDVWLVLRGGGGVEGYGFGEVAIRNLLVGAGQRDSIFLEVSVGGAGIFASHCTGRNVASSFEEVCTHVSLGGPHVGVGAEWRL